MIKSLTKEQEGLLPVYRDKWLEIGLSTEPANRVKAEEGIRLAYKIAGLAPPKIVWCGSPLGNALTRFVVLEFLKDMPSVRASVGDSVWASVWASVRASVWASVGDSVWASVRASVGDSVWASVWASVGDSVWASVGDSGYGQHDAHWLGFFDYFAEVLGLKKQTSKLEGLWMIAKSAGWFLPHEKICWISERHSVCKLKNGVLHCESGPAIVYPG